LVMIKMDDWGETSLSGVNYNIGLD
jgi:hypothetical protein